MSDFWNSFVQNLSLEMGAGKYLALTLVGIFVLWLMGRYKKNEKTRHLLLFGITMSALVIVPISAMALMAYQTRFYSYRHLLLLLFPMVFIPWALTSAVEGGYSVMKQNAEDGELVKEKPFVARMLGVLIATCLSMLSGNLLTEGVEVEFTLSGDKVPAIVMEALELMEDGDVLVAPDEVIEYARAYDGDLKLVYGRDMFEPKLKAFTYNVYDENANRIYEWMQDEPLNLFGVSTEELKAMQREKDVKAMDAVANTLCNTLVLSHAMYERLWAELSADEMHGFEMLEETSLYVVLKRR